MNQERVVHYIAQKAETRNDRAERSRLGDDIYESNLLKVTRHCSLDEHGAGQRVHCASIKCREIGNRGGRSDLAVERVTCLQSNFLALVNLRYRGDVRMVAIVATVWVVTEALPSIINPARVLLANARDGPCGLP
jgi:hypothetical protein